MSSYLQSNNLVAKSFEEPAHTPDSDLPPSQDAPPSVFFPPEDTHVPGLDLPQSADDTSPVLFGNESSQPVAGAMEPAPVTSMVSTPSVVGGACAPGFTMVDGDCDAFAKEYTPQMETPSYVGNTDMILQYLFREERKHHVTMPIRACGIDPIVFDNAPRWSMKDEDDTSVETDYFLIDDGEEKTEESVEHLYELIEVDGNLYLSCMTECLDSNYLHQVIADATTTMRETGSYIFRMVGLRRLAVDEDTSSAEGEFPVGKLLETLRLNTYEMSVLCNYMSDFNVEPTFEVIGGHRCICFRMK